jgi:hypothetical protein
MIKDLIRQTWEDMDRHADIHAVAKEVHSRIAPGDYSDVVMEMLPSMVFEVVQRRPPKRVEPPREEPTPGLVWVRRNWNGDGLDRAAYRLDDISGVHWSQDSGGQVNGFARRSPRPMVMGYVHCDAMVKGEVAHSCMHGPPPHSIKVVVVAKDNPPAVMRLVRQAATDNEARRARQ